MQKQTVEERYLEQQLMQGTIDAKVTKAPPSQQTISLDHLLQKISRGLVQTSQVIAQAESREPSQLLATASTKVSYVTSCLEQLKEELKVGNQLLEGSTTQQINQLSDYVKKAAHIIQLIQAKLHP